MHFCAGLPIILVGCKKDLRRDPRVVEELRKTNQRPVTPEEVRRIGRRSILAPSNAWVNSTCRFGALGGASPPKSGFLPHLSFDRFRVQFYSFTSYTWDTFVDLLLTLGHGGSTEDRCAALP